MTQPLTVADNLFSEDIIEFIARLKLLYEVPLSYLITGEKVLPPESIRFFYVDPNWIDALVRGALSLGRVSVQDGVRDGVLHRCSDPVADRQLRQIRWNMMHENHKGMQGAADIQTESEFRTGFIMRSVLVRRMKGLEFIGKSGDKQLEILRMETLADDIMICIFDGELTDLVVAEPKTGLKFGSPGSSDSERVIKVRSAADDDSFGKFLDKTVDLNDFTRDNGRLDVSGLAEQFGNILGEKVGAAKLAYELIAVARRAEFIKK